MSVDILDNVNGSKEFTIREMKNGRYRFLRRIEIQKAEVARQAKWHSRKTKSRTWNNVNGSKEFTIREMKNGRYRSWNGSRDGE